MVCLVKMVAFSLGIVLKNAKITKKGKSKANVASGNVVETLVITSSNIVQIVAEAITRVRMLDLPGKLYLLSLVYLPQTNRKGFAMKEGLIIIGGKLRTLLCPHVETETTSEGVVDG